MHKLVISKSRLMINLLICLILFLFAPMYVPSYVSAQEASTATTETSNAGEEAALPEESPPPKYVYNELTGLWENGTYAWDPVTNRTTPLTEVTYSYNPDTGHWDTTEWAYDPSAQSYTEQATISSTGPNSDNLIKNPIGPSTISNTGPDSTNSIEDGNGVINGTGPDSSNSIEGTTGVINGTGPSSTNQILNDSITGAFFENYYNPKISVRVDSTARTGDALVVGNTIGGNATSGHAQAYATILNYLQSSWSFNGDIPKLYSATLQGNHYGDLIIDPTRLAVSNGVDSSDTVALTQIENGTINNDVNLTAVSGSAEVKGNTDAGNATSGDAYAVANIMNFINSSIAAQQSFLGNINIYGDLDGDILMPELKEQLSAAGVPTTKVSLADSSFTIKNDSNYSIDNNIVTDASSGEAAVTHNTVGGSATSGSAETEVTVYNLLGENVSLNNGLLVFVNVMGEWVGFITGAPTGTSTALLGSGVQAGPVAGNYDYDISRTYDIANNVNVSSETGDAEVSNNTKAGNARTGDAYAAANVSNIINSTINAQGWFGALFINIFGNWHGNFGEDSTYGGYSTIANAASNGETPKNNPLPSVQNVRVYTLSSTGDSGNITATPLPQAYYYSTANNSNSSNTPAVAVADDSNDPVGQNQVLGSSTEFSVAEEGNATSPTVYIAILLMLAGLALYIRRRGIAKQVSSAS